MTARRIAAVLLASLLSACGGSGGASNSIPSTGSVPHAMNQAKLQITIPVSATASSHARKRQFVGSDVAGATIGVAPHGSTSIVTTAFDLSATSSLCTTGRSARTCTLTVNAPVGNDDFYVETFDAAPTGGAIPSTAHLLGEASISNVSIAGSGVPTALGISVLGAVSSVTAVAGGQLTVPGDGATHTSTLIVSGYDFGNLPINGTYANPITATLTEHGGSGHMHFTLNGASTGTTATLNSSSDTLAVVYDGGGTASAGYYASVSLTAALATSGAFNVVPMYVTSTSPYYTAANGLQFTASNQSATLTISEAVGSQTYHVNASTAAGCSSAATFGSVSGSGASAMVTVTSGSSAASACPFQILDTLNSGVQLNYTTTLTNGGVTIGGITEYTIPGSNIRLTGIVAGTDGNLYAVETIGNPVGTNHIDQISTSGTLVHQFTIPTANANPNALSVAPDGTIWFAEGGSSKVGHLDPVLGTFNEYTVPTFASSLPQSVAVGADGNEYFLDRGNMWVYQMNSQGSFVQSLPFSGTAYAIAQGSDGNFYLADQSTNQIAIVNPCCNPSYENIPTAGSGVAAITGGMAGQIWFTEPNVNQIGNVPTGTGGTPVEYATGGTDTPGGLTVGPDGNIWICAPGSNEILKFDVSSLSVTARYLIPTASASPQGITTGPDGRIWFTEFNTNKVGVLTP